MMHVRSLMASLRRTPERSIEPPEEKPVLLQCDLCDHVFDEDATDVLEEGDDCPLMVAENIYCEGHLVIYEDEPWKDRDE